MKCINFRFRTRDYQKYFYCAKKKEKIQYGDCKECEYKEYKPAKEIRKKSVRKEVMIVMFAGLALLFAGLAAYVHNDLFLRKAETVPGIVTEKRMHRNHATCTIFVDYEVDGKTYNEIYVGDGHDMQVGQKVTVYYNPEKPTKITDGRKIPTWSVYLVIIGGALFLIGGYLVFWMNQNPDKGIEIYNRIFKKRDK